MSKFNFQMQTVGCDWCSKTVDLSCAIFQSTDKRKHICMACPCHYGFELVEDFIPRAVYSVICEKYVEHASEQGAADDAAWVASDGSWSEC